MKTNNHNNRRKMKRVRRKRRVVTVEIHASHPNICDGKVQTFKWSQKYWTRAIVEEAILEAIQDMKDGGYKITYQKIGW